MWPVITSEPEGSGTGGPLSVQTLTAPGLYGTRSTIAGESLRRQVVELSFDRLIEINHRAYCSVCYDRVHDHGRSDLGDDAP